MTEGALNHERTVHEFYNTLANGEAQPGAAELACCRNIGLLKGGENALELIFTHSNAGVFNAKCQLDSTILKLQEFCRNFDLSFFSKLRCIVSQIQ